MSALRCVAAARTPTSLFRRTLYTTRMQLQAEQSKVLPALLNEQQQWFAVGGAVGVTSFLLGLLVTRGRRRRQWLN